MKGEACSKYFIVVLMVFLLNLVACHNKGTEEASNELKEWDGKNAEFQQRIEMLKSQLFDKPDDFQLLSALGDAYFESKRYAEAIQVYDKALKVNPKDADCLNDKALAHFYTGGSDLALESVNKAIEADPSYTHAWLSKGFFLVSMGRIDEAVKPLEKVKELDIGGRLAIEADNFLNQIKMSKEQK